MITAKLTGYCCVYVVLWERKIGYTFRFELYFLNGVQFKFEFRRAVEGGGEKEGAYYLVDKNHKIKRET